MWTSAAVLAVLGLSASFAPQEILVHAGSQPDAFTTTLVTLAGAAWIAFAILDWAARGNMMGGIYGRPIALANFAHFAIGAIVLVKVVLRTPTVVPALVVTAAYCVLAAAYGWILFVRDPLDH
jgi:hypothetical protein